MTTRKVEVGADLHAMAKRVGSGFGRQDDAGFAAADAKDALRELVDAAITERTMHAAWRKRAEEAEHAAQSPVGSGEVATETRRNWADAKAAGVVFYELPDALNYEMVDPLLRDVCRTINESGWVATGESCQGHPDSERGVMPWAGNLGPFLRLIVHRNDMGEMLARLVRACGPDYEHFDARYMRLHPLRLRLYYTDPHGEWESVNAYVDCSTTGEREEAIEALDKFAQSLQQSPVSPIQETEKPEVVCLCGSTRFVETFNEWRKRLTYDGCIVLSIEIVTTQAASEDPQHVDPERKRKLDELHLRKIDMADRVFVLNVGGYIGESTRNEINYATAHGKRIEYLEGDA